MKISIIQVSTILFVAALIFSLEIGMASDAANSSSVNSAVKTVKLQTTIVSCQDSETVGTGDLRARICVKDGEAYCKYDDYKMPSTTGECIFEGPEEN